MMQMMMPFSHSGAAAARETSSTVASPSKAPRRSWRKAGSLRRRILTDPMDEQAGALDSAHASVAYHWLADECPLDILPHILAFTGPQTTAALSKTNRHWRNAIMKTEGTWRVLCEETYKWKKGDAEPESWLEYYRMNPCVPTDYTTIDQALAVAQEPKPPPPRRSSRRRESPPPEQQPPTQIRNLRILLRPGKYVLRKPINVQTIPGVTLTMETLQVPTNTFCASATTTAQPPQEIMEQPLIPGAPHTQTPPTTHPKRPRSLRTLLSCNRMDEPEESETEEDLDDWLLDATMASSPAPSPRAATLVLRSRKHDEPTIWVRQGDFHLRHVDIQHQSYGLDIWNGNAAVQIQPTEGSVTSTAAATLDHCRITSASGRGIVTIDGGQCTIDHCLVRDCAATGIYIGGPGSAATIHATDVLRNGLGNRRHHRGIARGHSGIYLERGVATITESNVSNNTLTGLSVISPEHAVLELRASYLVQNGTQQVELPDVGTTARRRAITADNIMQGPVPTLRSGLE